MENPFVTRNVFFESSVSPFRQHGRMFGFVRRRLGTSRRLVGMPVGGSNTVIMSVGANSAMTTNSIGSPSLQDAAKDAAASCSGHQIAWFAAPKGARHG